LRPLVLADYNHLLEYSINEPEIWSFNSNGAEDLEKYISNAIKQREDEREYPFIVFDKLSEKYVGSTRFYGIFLEAKTIEIGYTWYGKSYQGTSVNKNCKNLLLEFIFEKLQMERVGFAVNIKNIRSINAMKSIGCTVEGALRNRSTDAKGDRIDVTRLSILKTEWFEEVKRNLNNKLNSLASP
jgi:RimJ/RimL family protein N-acetyltransferase